MSWVLRCYDESGSVIATAERPDSGGYTFSVGAGVLGRERLEYQLDRYEYIYTVSDPVELPDGLFIGETPNAYQPDDPEIHLEHIRDELEHPAVDHMEVVENG
jgi:hypothetical protein